MDGCSISTRVCASAEQIALKKMIEQLCASRQAFDHYKICLNTVTSSPKGGSCMSEFMSSTPGGRCSAIQNAANCMAKEVRDTCGDDALTYAFAAMNDYARMVDSRCRIDKPSVSIATGCSEQDMVSYLSCESAIDPFSFRPVSIIGDGTKWDEMCAAFNGSYRPCVEKMSCRFEPVSTANLQLFDGICNSLNSVMKCAGDAVEKACGYGALLHVYEQHTQWAQAYNRSCVVESPEPRSVPTNTLDQSKDVEPVHVTRDETTPSVVVLQKDTTPIAIVIGADVTTPSTTTETTTTTFHPKDITTTSEPDTTTPTATGSRISMLSALLVFFIHLRLF
ncbi:unnamed protein product [Nippostrongylus brasiliensis]|uniref:DUF19 domain-containing protein n=1 Tax=Nippostrongylus brasiliensis TaxID=27835 RepID=A0A0N4XET8_NIPBR|nr:unnamed protein product [Nippostrongylus brasiliensis]